MESKRKLFSVALVSAATILFLILISSTALATTLENPSLTINKTRITTSGSAEYPEIYGDNIVWQDNRSGNWDIYMYNISTKKEIQITTNKSAQTDPVVYGDKIVWLDMRNGENTDEFLYGGQDVYMYDLSTKKETRITGSTFEISPDFSAALDIYDNRIMWGTGRGFTIYDLSNKKENYTETTYGTYYPAFYGNWVVYRNEMSLGEGGDIYACDLSAKKETEIINNSVAGRPAIYGDRVVWTDARSSEDWPYENWDIYMYNLSTQKETQITTNGSAGDPVIYGDKILWVDGRSGSWEIYMYNISTHTETHTTNTSSSVGTIYGDRVVWANWQNGKTDIYMGTLVSSNLPTAAFSASPILGKAPLKVSFTDKSMGLPIKWQWNFGDGTSSTKQNPTHKYSKVGSYTVKLTVTNAKGSNMVTKIDYIRVVTKPVANFSAKPTSGKAPLTVAFTDQSTGIATKWKWSFGDGTISREKNPKHQYLQEGNYKITLTVSNTAGSSTVTKTNYIKVTTNTRPGILRKQINP
jgi:beta propeller repeat protein